MSELEKLDALEGDFLTSKQAAEVLNVPRRTIEPLFRGSSWLLCRASGCRSRAA